MLTINNSNLLLNVKGEIRIPSNYPSTNVLVVRNYEFDAVLQGVPCHLEARRPFADLAAVAAGAKVRPLQTSRHGSCARARDALRRLGHPSSSELKPSPACV